MRRSGTLKTISKLLCLAGAASLLASGGCLAEPRPEEFPRSATASDAIPFGPGPYQIEITGSDKRWLVRYPDASGNLQTAGGRSLRLRRIHVPLNTKVVFVLKSTDYVYTFAIPEHRLKEIAVPGLEFRMEFRTDKAGKFDLVGEPLCGDPHSLIAGQIVVDTHDRFAAWLERRL